MITFTNVWLIQTLHPVLTNRTAHLFTAANLHRRMIQKGQSAGNSKLSEGLIPMNSLALISLGWTHFHPQLSIAGSDPENRRVQRNQLLLHDTSERGFISTSGVVHTSPTLVFTGDDREYFFISMQACTMNMRLLNFAAIYPTALSGRVAIVNIDFTSKQGCNCIVECAPSLPTPSNRHRNNFRPFQRGRFPPPLRESSVPAPSLPIRPPI
jgi:hypothetical protein